MSSLSIYRHLSINPFITHHKNIMRIIHHHPERFQPRTPFPRAASRQAKIAEASGRMTLHTRVESAAPGVRSLPNPKLC